MDAKKKKKICLIAGTVVGILVIALVIVVLTLGSIVKAAVQTIGPKALGAEVKVSGVFINLYAMLQKRLLDFLITRLANRQFDFQAGPSFLCCKLDFHSISSRRVACNP